MIRSSFDLVPNASLSNCQLSTVNYEEPILA